MGRMKEPLTDHVQCRVDKSYHYAGVFFLRRCNAEKIGIRHSSGEWGLFSLSTFESEVCPWSELATTEGVAEKIAAFYAEHF